MKFVLFSCLLIAFGNAVTTGQPMQTTGAQMQTTKGAMPQTSDQAMPKTTKDGGAMAKTTQKAMPKTTKKAMPKTTGGAMPKTTKGYYTTGHMGSTKDGHHMGSTTDGGEPKSSTTKKLPPTSTQKPSDKARSSTSGAKTTGRSEHVKIVQMVELSFDKETCEANKKELGAAWRKSVGAKEGDDVAFKCTEKDATKAVLEVVARYPDRASAKTVEAAMNDPEKFQEDFQKEVRREGEEKGNNKLKDIEVARPEKPKVTDDQVKSTGADTPKTTKGGESTKTTASGDDATSGNVALNLVFAIATAFFLF